MLKNLMNRKSKSKGFTLIELIIVVAIIAILAAVAVPKYLEVKAKSTVKSDVSNAKIVYDTTVEALTDDKIELGDLNSMVEIKATNNDTDPGTIICNSMDTSNLKVKSNGDCSFYVIADANNNVIVYASNKQGENNQIYPDNDKAKCIYSSKYTGDYRNPANDSKPDAVTNN